MQTQPQSSHEVFWRCSPSGSDDGEPLDGKVAESIETCVGEGVDRANEQVQHLVSIKNEICQQRQA